MARRQLAASDQNARRRTRLLASPTMGEHGETTSTLLVLVLVYFCPRGGKEVAGASPASTYRGGRGSGLVAQCCGGRGRAGREGKRARAHPGADGVDGYGGDARWTTNSGEKL